MTGSQRITAIVLATAMVIGGFAFGRLSDTPRTSALENPAAPNQFAPNSPNQPQLGPQAQTQAAREDQAFYLSDYKVGYNEGFAAVRGNQTGALPSTTREGYNEGFKQGYADAYQAQNVAQAQPQSLQPAPAQTRYLRQPVYSSYPVKRRGSSKLKTALTIAAPAALGAGIGVAAGGKKGAAIGALVGGGGGALYHLFKNRDRD